MSDDNFDHPNAFDFDLISKHLSDLLDGKEIDMPIYSFKISKREEFCEKVKPANLIIFEGILSLYDKVNLINNYFKFNSSENKKFDGHENIC